MTHPLIPPYRSEAARRLRKIYEQHWVKDPKLTADEAEWLLRAATELEKYADPAAKGTLVPPAAPAP